MAEITKRQIYLPSTATNAEMIKIKERVQIAVDELERIRDEIGSRPHHEVASDPTLRRRYTELTEIIEKVSGDDDIPF
jgi:hypothetical protein